ARRAEGPRHERDLFFRDHDPAARLLAELLLESAEEGRILPEQREVVVRVGLVSEGMRGEDRVNAEELEGVRGYRKGQPVEPRTIRELLRLPAEDGQRYCVVVGQLAFLYGGEPGEKRLAERGVGFRV